MPSARTWRLLTRGDTHSEYAHGWALFQGVCTGLASAGWSTEIARIALGRYQGAGTPGAWWQEPKQRGRESEFDRAWRKATSRAVHRPADPTLARSGDVEHDTRVHAILAILTSAVLGDGDMPKEHRLLGSGKSAAPDRLILLALLEHARRHAAALPLTEDGLGVTVAAASRDLAMIINEGQRATSAALRSLRGRSPLVSLHNEGRRGDAHSYLLTARPVLDRLAVQTDPGAEAWFSQSSPQRLMSTVLPPLLVEPPDMQVLGHDAFVTDLPPGLPVDPDAAPPCGLSAQAALLLATVAANTAGLTPVRLAAVTGTSTRSVRDTLTTLEEHSLIEREPGSGLVTLATCTVEDLMEHLDALADRLRTRRAGQYRAAHFAQERAEQAAFWAQVDDVAGLRRATKTALTCLQESPRATTTETGTDDAPQASAVPVPRALVACVECGDPTTYVDDLDHLPRHVSCLPGAGPAPALAAAGVWGPGQGDQPPESQLA